MQLGILPLLGLMFIFLKLYNVIAWSWFWVLSPFIASFVLGVIFIFVFIFLPFLFLTLGK